MSFFHQWNNKPFPFLAYLSCKSCFLRWKDSDLDPKKIRDSKRIIEKTHKNLKCRFTRSYSWYISSFTLKWIRIQEPHQNEFQSRIHIKMISDPGSTSKLIRIQEPHQDDLGSRIHIKIDSDKGATSKLIRIQKPFQNRMDPEHNFKSTPYLIFIFVKRWGLVCFLIYWREIQQMEQIQEFFLLRRNEKKTFFIFLFLGDKTNFLFYFFIFVKAT